MNCVSLISDHIILVIFWSIYNHSVYVKLDKLMFSMYFEILLLFGDI